MKKRLLVYFTVAAFAFVCAGQVFGQAGVTTDQSDYPPGPTASINGSVAFDEKCATGMDAPPSLVPAFGNIYP
jgi:hypothetical protein